MNRTRFLAVSLLFLGLAVFAAALGQAGYVLSQLGLTGPTGAGTVSLAMALGAYFLMTICNITGGTILLLSSRNSAAPLRLCEKVAILLASLAQVLPLARWLTMT